MTKDFLESLNSAHNGDVQAMYDVGMMYYYGVASPDGDVSKRNYPEAYRWLRKVADSNCELRYHAYSVISRMYYAGDVPGEPQSYELSYNYNLKAAECDSYAAMELAYIDNLGQL